MRRAERSPENNFLKLASRLWDGNCSPYPLVPVYTADILTTNVSEVDAGAMTDQSRGAIGRGAEDERMIDALLPVVLLVGIATLVVTIPVEFSLQLGRGRNRQ